MGAVLDARVVLLIGSRRCIDRLRTLARHVLGERIAPHGFGRLNIERSTISSVAGMASALPW